MNSKLEKLKEISQKIDAISYLNNRPTSRTFKRIVRHQRGVLESEKEEEALKSAYKLKGWIWILINKTPHLTNEEEKIRLNNVINELGILLK